MNSFCSIVQWRYFIYACHKSFFQKSGFLQLPLQISFLHIFMLPVQKQLKQKPFSFALFGIWSHTPDSVWWPSLRDRQTQVLPLSSAPKSFSVQQPWRLPHDRRELDQWDVFGLFPCSASVWIHLSKSWRQYFFLFDRLWWEWASNPIQHSPSQWGTSHCPLWIPSSDTSWVIQCEGAGRLLAGPPADVQVCLGSCPVCCSACDQAHGLPEKRFWQVL